MGYKNYFQRMLEDDTPSDRVNFSSKKNNLGSYISPFTDEIEADPSIYPQGSFDYISTLEGLGSTADIINQILEEARKAGENPEAYSQAMAHASQVGPQLFNDIMSLINDYKTKHEYTFNLINAFGKTNVKVYEILVNRLNAYVSRFNNLWSEFNKVTGLAMLYVEDLEAVKNKYSSLVNDLNAFMLFVEEVHNDPAKITEISSALPDQTGFLEDVRDIFKYALYGGIVLIGWKLVKPFLEKRTEKK